MRTALITGASSGIGKELAKIFARKKANLVLVARNEQKLKAVQEEILSECKCSSDLHIIPADLSKNAEIEKVYGICQERNIHIDYLVNNAGFGMGGLFVEKDWETYSRMIKLNILGLTHLCHLFLPGMLEAGFGRIMNVSSLAGFLPGPNMAVYFASKAYVLHFTEALNMELKGSKVTVTALCPGPTDTAFQDVAEMTDSKLFKQTNLYTAQEVAEFGFNAMMNGWRVAIPGWKNMIMAKFSRIAPRSWAMNVAKNLNSKIQG